MLSLLPRTETTGSCALEPERTNCAWAEDAPGAGYLIRGMVASDVRRDEISPEPCERMSQCRLFFQGGVAGCSPILSKRRRRAQRYIQLHIT